MPVSETSGASQSTLLDRLAPDKSSSSSGPVENEFQRNRKDAPPLPALPKRGSEQLAKPLPRNQDR